MFDDQMIVPLSLEELSRPYQGAEPDPEPVDEEVEKMEFYTVLFVTMLFFFVMAACNEKYKPKCGHQTSFTIILGVVIALILWWGFGNERTNIYRFKQDVFFDFLLPPIILNSGFNMRRKKFFQNIGNIAIFGLGVTFVCFTLYSVATYLAIQYGGLEMINYSKNNEGGEGGPDPINIDIMRILLFTALLCSSDVVAAVSIVSYEAQPKLYSCVFGEGVFNDIVSIILFNTVQSLQGSSFYWYTPFLILGQFILLGVVSISIGLIFGIGLSLLIKHVRCLTATPIIETFLIFSFCYISYFVSGLIKLPNGLEMSGIISLLTCAIVSAHYTYYNISPQGKQATTLSFSFLGEMAEAAVYSYVGLALYSTIPTWWSWSFVFLQLAVIIGGRVCGVLSTFYCCRLCFKKQTIKFNELLFITYAGMIRGAIAFALVLKIQYQGEGGVVCVDCYSQKNYELVVSTTLMLVMLTTLIFGTFMDSVQKYLVPPKKSHHPSELMQHSPSQVSQSEYEEILHPNEEKSMISDNLTALSRRPSYLLGAQPASWANSRFVNWFVEFDEQKLRPFLIRNYSLTNVQMQDQFDDAISRHQTKVKDGDNSVYHHASFALDQNESLVLQNVGGASMTGTAMLSASADPRARNMSQVNTMTRSTALRPQGGNAQRNRHSSVADDRVRSARLVDKIPGLDNDDDAPNFGEGAGYQDLADKPGIEIEQIDEDAADSYQSGKDRATKSNKLQQSSDEQ